MESAQHDHLPPPLMAASIGAKLPVADPEPLLRLYGARLAECTGCEDSWARAILDGDLKLLLGAVFFAYHLLHHPEGALRLPERIGVSGHTLRVWGMLGENTEDPVLAVAEIGMADREAKAELLADAVAVMASATIPVGFGGSASAG